MVIATLLPEPGTPEKRKGLLTGGNVVIEVQKKKVGGKTVETIKERTGGVLHCGNENNPDMDLLREEIKKAYGGRVPRTGTGAIRAKYDNPEPGNLPVADMLIIPGQLATESRGKRGEGPLPDAVVPPGSAVWRLIGEPRLAAYRHPNSEPGSFCSAPCDFQSILSIRMFSSVGAQVSPIRSGRYGLWMGPPILYTKV